jgi:hypothetical protein
MRTDDLIGMLATGVGPVAAHGVERRYGVALAGGVVGAAVLMLTFLRVRPDLAGVVLLPMFWVKVGFVGSLAVASLLAVLRLSRPGVRLAWMPGAMLVPVVLIWVIAGLSLFEAEPLQRRVLFFGTTWKSCPLLIALLSVPVFVGVMWAMRGGAPTRARLAGFVAGLLSGATAALVYCLHCPELAAPFVGFWYLLGMLIPAGVGALLGPRLLRW